MIRQYPHLRMVILVLALIHCKDKSSVAPEPSVKSLNLSNYKPTKTAPPETPKPEAKQEAPSTPPAPEPTPKIVLLPFTADEICDRMQTLTEKNRILIFFQAMDNNNDLAKKEAFQFKIDGKKKLGEIFDEKSKGTNAGFVTAENSVPYDIKKFSFGRMISQIYEMPSANEPQPSQKFWGISKVCKAAECKNPDKSVVKKGEWQMTMGIDDELMADHDVYMFTLPGTDKLPKLNCVN